MWFVYSKFVYALNLLMTKLLQSRKVKRKRRREKIKQSEKEIEKEREIMFKDDVIM